MIYWPHKCRLNLENQAWCNLTKGKSRYILTVVRLQHQLLRFAYSLYCLSSSFLILSSSKVIHISWFSSYYSSTVTVSSYYSLWHWFAAFRVHSFPTIILWCLLNQLTWKLRCCKIPSLSKSSLGMASTVRISPSFYAKRHCPLPVRISILGWSLLAKWHNSIGGSELSYNFFSQSSNPFSILGC